MLYLRQMEWNWSFAHQQGKFQTGLWKKINLDLRFTSLNFCLVLCVDAVFYIFISSLVVKGEKKRNVNDFRREFTEFWIHFEDFEGSPVSDDWIFESLQASSLILYMLSQIHVINNSYIRLTSALITSNTK